VKRAAWGLIVAALLAGCGGGGGGGGDEDSGATGDGTTKAPAADTAVFRSKAIGFTFEYPKSFAAQRKPQGQVLGAVAVDSGGRLNAIKIRKTADRELGPDRYLDEFQRDFARTVGKVDKREETVGDLETGVLEFSDAIEEGGEKVEFTSTSYFFKGAGATWQMECIADSEHREEIESGCRAALESVDFKPGKI
jgi:hypothetical protein